MTVGSVHDYKDVIKHNGRGDCWITVHGKVYDVTTFLDDHPGGDEVLLAASGKDATVEYESVGHSDDAKKLMERFKIGEVDKSTLPLLSIDKSKTRTRASARNHSSANKILQLLIPFLILGFAYTVRDYQRN